MGPWTTPASPPRRATAPRSAAGARRWAALAAVLAVLVGAGSALVATAGPAAARQALFVDDSADPHLVPIIEDGTVAYTVYGTVAGPGRVAAIRAHLSPGDDLVTELAVPASGPETGFAQADLPRLTVVAPDGTVTDLLSIPGGPVADPGSAAPTVRVARLAEPALDGIYQLEVRAARPARFALAIGERDAGGKVLGYGGAAPDALATWSATPPPEAPPPTAAPADPAPEDEGSADDPGGPVASPLVPGPRADGGAALWWVAGVTVALAAAVTGLGVAGRAAAGRRAQLDEGSSG